MSKRTKNRMEQYAVGAETQADAPAEESRPETSKKQSTVPCPRCRKTGAVRVVRNVGSGRSKDAVTPDAWLVCRERRCDREQGGCGFVWNTTEKVASKEEV